MRGLLIAAGILALRSMPALAANDPWAAMAKRDLNAIRELVLHSHPGVLDTKNPHFSKWLESGYSMALSDAAAARSLGDYQRVLRLFINGFRDNHMRVRFESGTDQAMWPSFSVEWRKDGRFIVAVSEDAAVPLGAEVLSCDNVPLAARMDRDVLPYVWNDELPHAKRWFAANLFIAESFTARPKSCAISMPMGPAPVAVSLDWRAIPGSEAARLRRETNGLVIPERGVRDVGGVTFISLPSMDPEKGFESFFSKVERNVDTIRKRPIVVLDFRGNRGGHSAIGHRLLSILFGAGAVARIVNSFDWTNEIRVSAGNAQRYRSTADGMQASGAFPQGEVDEVRKVGDRIEAAAARGDRFLRGGSPGRALGGPTPPSPFQGRVYLLTDSVCASACLDTVDVALRLPGVVHVGLPTEADAVYMESRHEMLPSGLTRFTFGIKVVRNRIRKNNEWYEPRFLWQSGKMTDEAVATWLRELGAVLVKSNGG